MSVSSKKLFLGIFALGLVVLGGVFSANKSTFAQVMDSLIYLPILRNHDPSILLHLTFDEAEGATKFSDITLNQHNGTCSGSACPTSGVAGVRGNAARFDGANDSVSLGDPSAMDINGEISMAAWVRLETESGLRNIIAHGYRTNPNAAVFLRIGGNRYIAGMWNGDSQVARGDIQPEEVGEWVHLVGVYDGEKWRLYKNGKVAGAADAALGSIPMDAPWAIGSRGNGSERFFHGDIDEVMVYNRALTPEAVSELYESYDAP